MGNKFLGVLLLFSSSLVFADYLPYQSARVDVFMRGSNIHGIEEEFAVLSVDDRIKAIGRVSTGRGGATPARRWQIIGIEYYKTSNKYGSAPMPKAINLSKFGELKQTNFFFHGSSHYDEFDGYAHSKGCIRLVTVNDPKKDVFEDPGLHLSFWKILNPKGFIKNENEDGYKTAYINWGATSAEAKEYLKEMREKITVYTHRGNSLSTKQGWKESFERLYDVNLIQAAINYKDDKGKFLASQEMDEALSTTQLSVLDQIENSDEYIAAQ